MGTEQSKYVAVPTHQDGSTEDKAAKSELTLEQIKSNHGQVLQLFAPHLDALHNCILNKHWADNAHILFYIVPLRDTKMCILVEKNSANIAHYPVIGERCYFQHGSIDLQRLGRQHVEILLAALKRDKKSLMSWNKFHFMLTRMSTATLEKWWKSTWGNVGLFLKACKV